MTTKEKVAALASRGCDIIEDKGDFALVYPIGNGSKRAHDLAAKSHEAALVEAWDWLYPEQYLAERIDVIQRVVAKEYGTTVHDLCNGGRPEPLATARRVAMVLTRQLTPASHHAVGHAFNRDHASVIHAEKSIADQCMTDHQFGARLGAIRELCKATIAMSREKKPRV